ncbi:type II toxin-antitoxin system YhaV family toxin [Megalodesulfovibrio paquesii]
MQRHGWTLLFHECLVEQLQRLEQAAARALARNPEEAASNANVKLFRALSRLILETIPEDPTREGYRQGNTMGPAFRHWCRVKVGRRFRLYFRFDSNSKVIIFAWANDEQPLRSAGSRSDPYAVFQKMLHRGHPPAGWAALVKASKEAWGPTE